MADQLVFKKKEDQKTETAEVSQPADTATSTPAQTSGVVARPLYDREPKKPKLDVTHKLRPSELPAPKKPEPKKEEDDDDGTRDDDDLLDF